MAATATDAPASRRAFAVPGSFDLGVHDERERPIVDELDRHLRAEAATFDVDPVITDAGHEALDQRRRDVGRGGG